MGEAQQERLYISAGQEEADHEETNTTTFENPNVKTQSLTTWLSKYKRWLEIGIYTIIILTTTSAATILGRLYYDKGGKSKWLASLVQNVGFPVLLPFLFINTNKNKESKTSNQDDDNNNNNIIISQPSILILLSIYVLLGLLMGGGSVLLSTGLLYLPVTTFSIITSSQLGFTVFVSYFMNSLKITPLIANSVVLLTISSILLVLEPDESSGTESSSSRKHYVIGFTCTLIASAGFAFALSLTELIFRKILKRYTIKQAMDIVICQSFSASCVILVGLLASGEYKELKTEMQEFELGKVSYVMILVWISLCWQIFTIGLLGLIMKVSAVFANVISCVGVPLVPILAIIVFHEKMSGVKGVSMVLAFWGFLSYTCQQYIDQLKFKAEKVDGNGSSEISIAVRG